MINSAQFTSYKMQYLFTQLQQFLLKILFINALVMFEKMFLSQWFLDGNLDAFLKGQRGFRYGLEIFLRSFDVFKCWTFVALTDFSLFWAIDDVVSRLGNQSSTSMSYSSKYTIFSPSFLLEKEDISAQSYLATLFFLKNYPYQCSRLDKDERSYYSLLQVSFLLLFIYSIMRVSLFYYGVVI